MHRAQSQKKEQEKAYPSITDGKVEEKHNKVNFTSKYF